MVAVVNTTYKFYDGALQKYGLVLKEFFEALGDKIKNGGVFTYLGYNIESSCSGSISMQMSCSSEDELQRRLSILRHANEILKLENLDLYEDITSEGYLTSGFMN